MRPILLGGVLACGTLLAIGASLSARAMMIAPPPGPMKVAQADVIVTGQVMGIEDRDVEVPIAPNSPQKVKYRVAVLKVNDVIKGDAKLAKLLRVAFQAPPAPAVGPGGGPVGGPGTVFRPGFRRPGVVLNVGQDGLFYLKKLSGNDLYTLPAYYSYVNSSDRATLEREINEARKTLKILQDPMASLKSKDGEERLLTAALLIGKYRAYQGSPKTEPIAAEESKLILKALADADWNVNRPGFNYQMNPLNMFGQLGISAKDGFQFQPQPGANNPNAYPDAVKAWLKDHWQTYRIQKFVAGPANVGQPGGIGVGQPGVAVPGGPIQIQPIPVNQPGGVQILPVPAQPGGGAVQIEIQVQPAQPAQLPANPGK